MNPMIYSYPKRNQVRKETQLGNWGKPQINIKLESNRFCISHFYACGYVLLNTWDRQTLLLANLIIGRRRRGTDDS